MLIIYVLIVAIALFLTSFWLFYHSHLEHKSAKINCIIFKPTNIQIELEPTLARKVGNGFRYLLYLFDLLAKTIHHKVERVYNKIKEFLGLKSLGKFRRYIGLRRELWRKKNFFPSFKDWVYKLEREEREFARMPHAASPHYVPPVGAVHLIGTMKLPKRIYANDACVIELSFIPELTYFNNVSPKLSVVHRKDDGGVLICADWNSQRKHLEVKLIGVGINVTPLDPEIQSGDSVYFSWGCAFPNSGLQTLVFQINLHLHLQSYNTRLIHTVKVVQLDHLTSRQIRVLASITAILGVISTTLGILKAFGILLP